LDSTTAPVEHQAELDDLRGLHGDRPDLEPVLVAVDGGTGEQHQHLQGPRRRTGSGRPTPSRKRIGNREATMSATAPIVAKTAWLMKIE
jgi:hypothetical protein